MNVVHKADDMLCCENDRVTSVFSLFKGQVSYVLPEFNFCEYIYAEEGDSLGYVDICQRDTGEISKHWFNSKDQLYRKFTTRCQSNVEILELGIDAFDEMNNLFPDDFRIATSGLTCLYLKMDEIRKNVLKSCIE